MDLMDDVQKMIEERLPSMQADVWRKFVEKAQQNEIDLERLEEKHGDLETEHEMVLAQLTSANAIVAASAEQEAKLNEREAELWAREREVYKKELLAEHSEQRVKDHVHMMELLLKNRTVRESVTVPGAAVVVPHDHYVDTSQQFVSKTTETERTEE